MHNGMGNLSRREAEVLRLATKGLTDKEIAVRVGLSLTTIRTYWERIRPKIGASNRASAVAWYVNADMERQIAADGAAIDARELALAAIEAIGGGLIILDRDGMVQTISPHAMKLLNQTPEALAGKAVESVISTRCHAFYSVLKSAFAVDGLPSAAVIPATFAKVNGRPELLVTATITAVHMHGQKHIIIFLQDAVEAIDARRRGHVGVQFAP